MPPKFNQSGVWTHDLQIMTQYISCHWDACSNHLAISDFPQLKSYFFYISLQYRHNESLLYKIILHIMSKLVL